MSPVLLYPVKVILCSGILFGYYLLALRNNRFHGWNRYYLLLAVAASVIIPLLRLPLPFDFPGSSSGLTVLPVYAGGLGEMSVQASSQASSWLPDFGTSCLLLYGGIACLLAGRFVYSLLRIRSAIRKVEGRRLSDYIFVNTSEATSPYSFFRYVFWNADIDLQTPQGKKILQHELVHVNEKHTADKLFMEVVRIFFWFNPFFYLIRRELELIHEFIADTQASEGAEDELYQQLLIFQAFNRPQLAGANHFFHHKIKRRLHMLTTSAQPRFGYLRRVMVLPLTIIVLSAFSAGKKDGSHLSQADKKVTMVVDAGNRGDNPYGRNVNDILTGDDDHYVPSADLRQGDTLLPPSAARLKQVNPADVKEIVSKKPDSIIIHLKDGNEIRTTKSMFSKYFPPPPPPKPKPTGKVAPTTLNGHQVFNFVQQMPRYPGAVSDEDSNNKIMQFLHEHVHYPDVAKDNGIQGVVTVTFIVRTDGSLQDIRTVGQPKGGGLDEEALRVIKMMPHWLPGKQNGRPVNVQFTLPVHFQLQ